MKRLFIILFVLVGVVSPLALIAAAALVCEDAPRVQREIEFTADDVARARSILALNDPRQFQGFGVPVDGLHTIVVSAADVDLAVNYALHRLGRGSSRLALAQGVLTLDASLRLPHNPFGDFVNVHALLRDAPGFPQIESLRLGRLPVPATLAGFAVALAQASLRGNTEYRLLADTLRSVSIADDRVSISYRWDGQLPDRLRAATLPAAERERLRVYQEGLAQISAAPELTHSVSLSRLLAPLLRLAHERSAAGADAQAEQRALLAVLAFYVNGRNWATLIPEARNWPPLTLHRVTLRGRTDLAQHFIVSAAIAAFAGTPLADAIGLYKELDDAHGGSGFSFVDLAADRSGTLFGQLGSGDRVTDLQRRGAAIAGESAIIPDIAGLPEDMAEAEFKRRFGGVDAPPYQAMLAEIERRVAACALYRP
ncbi:hypothetical protein [Rhodocyclus tenuis]|uniref:hypothetical protein n=1 Tax=Rhodocyclus tenuis TaxID=1066 RepID=UPI00190654B9|nr:hypothetical protein [Rhodocyclus tenuis]MBK1679693.1 hypothetical protein [Rhodocyclus tenuis]